MKSGSKARAVSGRTDAVIDWIVLTVGVVLMAGSILFAIMPRADQFSHEFTAPDAAGAEGGQSV
ncbi:MAG: hypothetical protein D6801_00380 [Alphaproteobacteria bacterium]|nr:MAG: hypothetical protein D6801_00380 [Alphaproteobacteria bacterium]